MNSTWNLLGEGLWLYEPSSPSFVRCEERRSEGEESFPSPFAREADGYKQRHTGVQRDPCAEHSAGGLAPALS